MSIFNIKHLFKFFQLAAVTSLLGVLMSGCIAEEYDKNTLTPDEATFLTLELDIPQQSLPMSSGTNSNTKAGEVNEKLINNIQVLVFSMKNGEEVFDYSAEFTESENYTKLKAKLNKHDEKVRIAVLANYSKTLPPSDTPMNAFLEALTFDSPITTGQLPMWGDSKDLTITSGMQLPIKLMRSTARVDVGLNLKASGADRGSINRDFKPVKIHLFETNASGYVGYTDNQLDGSIYKQPWAPTGAEKKSLEYPFLAEDNNCIEKQIYLSEMLPGQTYMVLEGIYEGGQCFYRLDFKETNDASLLVDAPVLRNYCYQFNITEVTGKGWGSLEDAKKNGTSHIDYELISWDESITSMWNHNDYFFGLSALELQLGAKAGAADEVICMTNLKDFTYTWKEADGDNWFTKKKQTDGTTKEKIALTAKYTNYNGKVTPRTLVVGYKDWFSYEVLVSQANSLIDYTVDCSPIQTHGTYVVGEAVGASHYLTVDVTVPTGASGGNYMIETNEVNGLSFKGAGKFAADGKQTIQLLASGTPKAFGTHTYTITFDDEHNSTCTNAKVKALVKRKIVYKMKNNDNSTIANVPISAGNLTSSQPNNKFTMLSDGEFLFDADESKLDQTYDVSFYHYVPFKDYPDEEIIYTMKSPYTARDIIANPDKAVELRVQAIDAMGIFYGIEDADLAKLLTPIGHRITRNILRTEVLSRSHADDQYIVKGEDGKKTCEFIIGDYYNRNEDDEVKISMHTFSKNPAGNVSSKTSNKETYAQKFSISDIKGGSLDFTGEQNLTQLTLRREFKYDKTKNCNMKGIKGDNSEINVNGPIDRHNNVDTSIPTEHAHYDGGADRYASIIINYQNIGFQIDKNEVFDFNYFGPGWGFLDHNRQVKLSLLQILETNTIIHK